MFTVSFFHHFYKFIDLYKMLVKLYECKEIQIEARFLISVTVHMATVGFWLTEFSIHSLYSPWKKFLSPANTLFKDLVGYKCYSVPTCLPEPWKFVSPGWSSSSDSFAIYDCKVQVCTAVVSPSTISCLFSPSPQARNGILQDLHYLPVEDKKQLHCPGLTRLWPQKNLVSQMS